MVWFPGDMNLLLGSLFDSAMIAQHTVTASEDNLVSTFGQDASLRWGW
jgi:hypothetical protein